MHFEYASPSGAHAVGDGKRAKRGVRGKARVEATDPALCLQRGDSGVGNSEKPAMATPRFHSPVQWANERVRYTERGEGGPVTAPFAGHQPGKTRRPPEHELRGQRKIPTAA